MSEISPADAGRLSSLLVSGNVDEITLREIAALREIPADLVKNMLMVLSDTTDARIRNILSVTLAQAGVKEAASRIVHLLKETKTSRARGTLLYALQLLHANLDLSTLVDIILTDTPEAREEALVLLEELSWILVSLNPRLKQRSARLHVITRLVTR